MPVMAEVMSTGVCVVEVWMYRWNMRSRHGTKQDFADA
jgi:hypothetical protein